VEGQVHPALSGHGHLPKYAALLFLAADALGAREHDAVDDQAVLGVQVDFDAESLLSLR
jgi:hypothetical protein